MMMWYGKTRVTSYDLRVESLKAQDDSLKGRVKIQKCEFKPTSYEFKSTRSRIIKSIKTQVNSLQIFITNEKIKSDVIHFASQTNFEQAFV